MKQVIRRRSFEVFGAAMLVAAFAFWATMFTSPPKTEASGNVHATVSGAPAELFSVALSKVAHAAPEGSFYDAH